MQGAAYDMIKLIEFNKWAKQQIHKQSVYVEKFKNSIFQ